MSRSFEKTLDAATSNLKLELDWNPIMTICDIIRQNDVSAKNAITAIKKKMQDTNPHTANYACCVLESIVKNCGTPVHEEISTTANCEFFANLINHTKHENVRTKMLELIQTWSHAFRTSPKYQAIKDTMNILKAEGHKFPELKESDAMFSSDTAPEWAEGDVCHRCRTPFTITNRKHHCRNCGQVFCGKCSSKNSTIPKYGIEKEVRVCDACFVQLQKPHTSSMKNRNSESDLPVEYLTSSLAQQSQGPPRRTERELQEEEELQLAIALSQSEAEQKSKSSFTPRRYTKSPSPEPIKKSPSPVEEINDPELARYLNRVYWEQKTTNDSPASPSAPSPLSQSSQSTPQALQNPKIIGDKTFPDDEEINEFTSAMKGQLEIFVNRMKSNQSRGRSISTDSSVQTLFMTLTSLHSKLLNYTKDMDDKRLWYEQLQDKLNQIRDSRAALDVLRQEHKEKLIRQAEEQERLRQFQMQQKLEIMRKKKQEYLQYQRQIALQRIQQQEREMQMRQEQQKAQYRMASQNFPYIASPGTMGQQGSPIHQMPGGNMYGQFGYSTIPRFVPPNQPSSIGPVYSGAPMPGISQIQIQQGMGMMQGGAQPPNVLPNSNQLPNQNPIPSVPAGVQVTAAAPPLQQIVVTHSPGAPILNQTPIPSHPLPNMPNVMPTQTFVPQPSTGQPVPPNPSVTATTQVAPQIPPQINNNHLPQASQQPESVVTAAIPIIQNQPANLSRSQEEKSDTKSVETAELISFD